MNKSKQEFPFGINRKLYLKEIDANDPQIPIPIKTRIHLKRLFKHKHHSSRSHHAKKIME